MKFYVLHKLFDELVAGVLDYVDMLAERATALGGIAKGTIRMTAKASKITHSPDTFDNAEFTVKKMAETYALLAESTRNSIEVTEKLGIAV